MITPLKTAPAKPDWDAKAYQQFSKLRQRPVNELLDRVDLDKPKRIYDLGCGTGIATQVLSKRWPRAQLMGIDSSKQMLVAASCLPIKAQWKQCDLQTWQPEQPGRVVVEGVNIATKHTKPSAQNTKGGIVKIEAAINISNVQLWDAKTSAPTKVTRTREGGKLVRISKKSGEVIK